MANRANNVIRIPTSLNTDFFKYWLLFLAPFHNLAKREIDVAAEFLKQRHILSLAITDNTLLDKISMSEEIKRTVRENCGISLAHFQGIISKLKERQIIVNNKLNPKFIPNIVHENNNFQLLLLFDFTNDESRESS